ncbi:hypothetical protein V8J88_12925 [Massilia sp. W12]|uniref:ATP-binding protein n=1 Tax=Massilia sp. W12 TaxID=3126507 RepID=UPI0030CFF890
MSTHPNFDALLDQRVVIELDEIKDEGDKALLMGLIITRLAECMKQRHQANPAFRHLTLIEEAHRLLSRPEPGESGSKKLGVDMFCNLLAEVRKYGEGLIIAEQIPNKLVPDVIKNTNTKIVHRLFSADDRDVIGNAMAMRDDQKDFLPLLRPGEAVMYSGGWHAPTLLKIHHNTDTSRNPIAEQQVLEQELQRQWKQRQELFPHLARTGLFEHAAQLAQGQEQLAAIWSLILALTPLRAQERPSKVAERQAIATRLARHVLICAWQGEDLAQGLVAYLLDHASVDNDTDLKAGLLKFTRFIVQADADACLSLQTSLTNSAILPTIDTWLKNGTLYHLH